MLAPMAAGHEIYTVESLAQDGKLAPAQAGMAAAGGSQCGYCTPGFVMSLFAEQYRKGRSGPCDWRELGGNLCRCTGYRPIKDAAVSLGAPPDGPFLNRLANAAPEIGAAEYAHGAQIFSRPTSIGDCLSMLADNPEARLIAGGTDMAVESNLKLRRWAHLVSTEAIAELQEFDESAQRTRIGAGMTLNEISRHWKSAPDCFAQWVPWLRRRRFEIARRSAATWQPRRR